MKQIMINPSAKQAKFTGKYRHRHRSQRISRDNYRLTDRVLFSKFFP
jgi:hypothetical protein